MSGREKGDQHCGLPGERIDRPCSGGNVASHGCHHKKIFDEFQQLFQAFGRDIFHVGEQVGMGQVAKACQLALSGFVSAATAEALTLGVKAGLKAEVLYGGITLLKDLTVVVQTGKDHDVPLFTAATALEMVALAKSIAPDDDVAAIVKGLEKITGVEVRKSL